MISLTLTSLKINADTKPIERDNDKDGNNLISVKLLTHHAAAPVKIKTITILAHKDQFGLIRNI